MGTKSLYQNTDTDVRLLADLVGCLEARLEARGVPKRETPGSVWHDFAMQAPEIRSATISNLTEYLNILEYAESQVQASGKEQQLLWHVIKYLGLVPPDDFFNYIAANDYVEIYNASGIQVYRNLEFCKIVSYSIAEMSVYRWDQLYSRSEVITNLIITEGFQKGFSGTKEMFKPQIPKHSVAEVFGGRNRVCNAEFGYICPLTDRFSKGITHILSTCRITPANPSELENKRSA